MKLLDELRTIQHLLDLIPSDNVPKRHAQNFNLAKNQLMRLISEGERIESQKGLSVVKPRIRVPPVDPDEGCEACQ